MSCCGEFGFLRCNGSMLSIYQIAVGWLNSLVLYVLVLVSINRIPLLVWDLEEGDLSGVIESTIRTRTFRI